jgi:hypothetical protein
VLKDVLAVIVPHVDSVRESLSVLALHRLPQSSFASRRTPGAAGFFHLIQSGRASRSDIPALNRETIKLFSDARAKARHDAALFYASTKPESTLSLHGWQLK